MSSERLGSVLGLEDFQGVRNQITGAGWLHDVIYIPALSCLKRVSKGVLVIGSFLFNILTSEDNLDGTLGSHDGDLGGGPSVVVVSVEMLGAHHIVGTTIGLSGDEGNLGHGGLSVGIEELSTVLNDTSELLNGSWEESWDISQCDNRNLEGVTETDETSTLN